MKWPRLPRLPRARTLLWRLLFPTGGGNFTGFDKYRRDGAYHWAELQKSECYRRKIEAVLSCVERGHLCLDIGCGDGAYMSVVAPRCRGVVGIDADADAVVCARRELSRHGVTNATCVHLSIGGATQRTLALALLLRSLRRWAQFRASGMRFDVIYSMDVIEHLPDPTELLRTAARLAKPTARIAIGTPLFLRPDLVSPYHVRELTRDEIRGLVTPTLRIERELLLPTERLDGKTYDASFYVAIATPR